MTIWQSIGFELETTADGSYSLKILSTDGTESSSDKDLQRPYRYESMHHSGGALTETMYIYAPIAIASIGLSFYNQLSLQNDEQNMNRVQSYTRNLMRRSLENAQAAEKDILKLLQNLDLTFIQVDKKNEQNKAEKSFNFDQVKASTHLVVGLGLGYIELMLVSFYFLFLQQRFFTNETPELRVESFESVPQLREWFQFFIVGEKHESNTYYEKIFEQILQFSRVDLKYKKTILEELKKVLYLNSELSLEKIKSIKPYSALYFDAFSQKTSPDLWSSEFLQELFCRSQDLSFFSTYACTGFLKRSLQEQNFKVIKREGFKGKRDSTLAVKMG